MIPGMGVNAAQMAKAQEVGKLITGVVRIDYKENTMTLKLETKSPEAKDVVTQIIGQFGESLAMQLKAMFAIEGEIIEVGKKTE